MLNKKIFNTRAFISLSIFLTFVVLTVTSLLMFANKHTESIAMLHTLVGFGLLLMVLWHIKNNVLALLQYFSPRRHSPRPYTNLAMPAAAILVAALVAMSLAQLPPLQTFYQWGNSLRAQDKTEQSAQFSYIRIDNSPAAAQGKTLSIDLRKGPYFMFPQYAIWLENLDGSLIQPLYITQTLATNNFINRVTKRNKDQVLTSNPLASGQNPEDTFQFEVDPASAAQRFRPESLPVFLHKLNSPAAKQLFAATNNSAAGPLPSSIDAYSGATLLDNFLLATRTAKPLPETYRLRLEINQSFDFNQFYSSDRFVDDPIYSGTGYSAQPSVIYEVVIDSRSNQRYYPMQLIGRGHHSGRDGEIYGDMENLTTAAQIIDRVIVEVGKE